MEAERAANLLACLRPDPEAVSWKGATRMLPAPKWKTENMASHVITGIVHHIHVLRRAAQVDISKEDENFSYTGSLIRLGPGYLLQPSRRPTDCRDLIMFTHSLEFLYRDTRMHWQGPKCCFWQQLVPGIAPICLETWWHTFFVLQPAAHTTCTCDNPWIYICRVTAV